VRRVGPVVSVLDSRPGDPGSNLGTAHKTSFVTSLGKMPSHTELGHTKLFDTSVPKSADSSGSLRLQVQRYWLAKPTVGHTCKLLPFRLSGDFAYTYVNKHSFIHLYNTIGDSVRHLQTEERRRITKSSSSIFGFHILGDLEMESF
jgi:hypothetical protein